MYGCLLQQLGVVQTDGGPATGTSSKGEDNLKTYITVEEHSRSRVFATYWELFLKL